ncbi:unnamed protein product [Oreochromis niloticus]|nr:unnamed protein product [Mustela putorius furo]
MRHCRQSKSSLISLLSASVTTLAQMSLYQNTTERVWIGLRYLGDRWLWLYRKGFKMCTTVYDARPHGDKDYQCPLWNRCGAKGGQWENQKCEERLNFICA